jgi:hypothetical protein
VKAFDGAGNSSTATITITTATALAVTTSPGGAVNGKPFGTQPVVQLRDDSGTNVSLGGVEITASIASGGGTLGGTMRATTNAGGAAVFTDLSITGSAGAHTLGFAAGSLTATSASFTLAAGSATKIIVSSIGTQTVNVPFDVTVTLADVSNNPTPNVGGTATITLARQTGTGTVTGTTSASLAAGASSTVIHGVAYTVAETGVRLSATGSSGSADGVTGTSNAFNVLAASDGTPPTVAITTPTSAATYTTTADNISLGGTAADNVGVTSVTWANNRGGSGTAVGTTSWSVATVNLVSGVNVLTVTSHDAEGNVGTATLSVTRSVATKLALTTAPSSSAASGTPFARQPVVQLVDANGAAVARAGVTITAAIASGGGTLGGQKTVATDANGSAAFSDLSITGVVGTRTLSFNAAGLAGVVSPSITLTAGAAAKLGIATIGTQVANAPFNVTVTLLDASGNAVANSGAAGTIRLSRQSGSGTLGGVTSGTIGVGVSSISISGVTYSAAGSGVTLLATGSGSGSAVDGQSGTSNPFDVTSDTPTGSYSTNFSTSETPISEGGRWLNGGRNGVDWTDVRTNGDIAFATAFVESTGALKDAIAILDPAVTPLAADQFAEAVVHRTAGYQGANGHEIELLLRFTLRNGVASGYEFLLNAGGGSQIVRWNGPIGNFTVLSTSGPGFNVPADGDVIRAEASGNVLRFYQNGSLRLTASDGTFASGQSGVGFYVHSGGGNALDGLGWTSWRTGALP